MVRSTATKLRKHKTKHYTYLLNCSFDMQFTFTESEVEQDSEGGKGDFVPTDGVLKLLAKELENYLANNYVVQRMEVEADSDFLLGVNKS